MSEANGYVTREAMLAPIVRRFKDLDVPFLGRVEIQNFTEAERAKVESYNYRKDGSVNREKIGDVRCRLCVIGTSKPQLTMNDVEALRNKDVAIIDFLSTEIAKHAGVSIVDAEEVEKKVETRDGT